MLESFANVIRHFFPDRCVQCLREKVFEERVEMALETKIAFHTIKK
jgi:hypothetical protein